MPQTSHLTRAHRTLTAAAVALATAALFAGCGGPSLTASSSCRDYMNASSQDQYEAVNRIATDERAPNATSPLGRPNIAYLCSGQPNMTLGTAIAHSN